MIDVVCAIIEQEKTCLVCQRSGQMHLSGFWEFPGGKVHDGESNEEALVREIKEELNLDINELRYFDESIFQYEEKLIRLIAYTCVTKNSNKIVLREHRAYSWLEKHQLSELKWAPADIPLMKKLREK